MAGGYDDRANPYGNQRAGSAIDGDEGLPQVEQMEGDAYNYAGRLSKQSYLEA